MIDTHIHIERGNYSLEWINEFVEVALSRGLSEIYLLEHSHRFKEFKKVYDNIGNYNDFQKSWLNRKMKISLNDYKNFILDMNKNKFPIKIKFGLEVCFIEGTEEIVKNILHDFKWDFVTGSVHWIDGWGFDHKKEHWFDIDVNKAYIRYYKIMKNLIKSKLFNIVAHPDSVKCFGYHPSYDLEQTYYEIADLLNNYNVIAEQNSGLYYRYNHEDLGMNRKMYDIFKSKNVCLCTGSDAHRPEDTGKYIKELNEV